MTPAPGASESVGRRVSPFVWALDRLSSIWLAVGLLVLVFIYASIGSALPPIRQGALADWLGIELLRFDKTEMEWFSWWPFQVLIGLFCLSLLLITARKIPATLADTGVWFIHIGIIVLLISCAVYFGTKVEGDTVVFGSRALVLAPGMTEPASLVVRPDASIEVGPPGGKTYRVQVAQMMPGYEILTGEHKGETDQAIWFNITTSDNQQFARIVLAHYPEYTEDVVTATGGMQRAINVTGQRLIDPGLQIQMDSDPARYFYHAHRMPVRSMGAVYARFDPAQEWTQLRLPYLPYYYDHLTHREELWPTAGRDFPPPRPLDLRPEVPADAGAVGKLDIRVTDYLAYARLQSRWTGGGDALNPVVRIQYLTAQKREVEDLLALSPNDRKIRLSDNMMAELVWPASPEERQKWLKEPHPRLRLRMASRNLDRTVDLKDLSGKDEPFAVAGTDLAVELREVFPEGAMGTEVSPAMVLLRFSGGGKTFDRVVMVGDTSGGRDLGAHAQTQPSAPDLKVEYLDPVSDRLLLVGGENESAAGLDLVVTRRDGTFKHQKIRLGEPVPVPQTEGVLSVEAILPRARSEIRPAIVPREQRQSMQDAGKRFSLLRVEVNDGQRLASAWLPFNEYAFPDEQRAQPGRFTYQPRTVQLSDGRQLQLLYSRPREPLASAVALDRFIRKTYPGGDRESDYISLLQFETASGWSPLVEVRSNHPARHGDLWYFQSQWDPGTEAHTVLGVGNRRAVNVMLAGVCISIIGMAWAFYVRPALRRKGAGQGVAVSGQRVEPEVTRA